MPTVSDTRRSSQPRYASTGKPKPSRPVSPYESHTSVNPCPGAPSPRNPFKESHREFTTTANADYRLFDTHPTQPVEHGSHGLAFELMTTGHGKKAVFSEASADAGCEYKHSSEFQTGAQMAASGNLGSTLASTSSAVDPYTGNIAAKLNAGISGPQATGILVQKTQLGSQVENEFLVVGLVGTGGANVSLLAQYKPATRSGEVSAGFSATGPSALIAVGHQTTLGPFTISNAWAAVAGTTGLSARVYVENKNGVLNFGASSLLLAGLGYGSTHSISLDTNYGSKQAPPPHTALEQARHNQKKYGEHHRPRRSE